MVFVVDFTRFDYQTYINTRKARSESVTRRKNRFLQTQSKVVNFPSDRDHLKK
jgi:hypothetical protein